VTEGEGFPKRFRLRRRREFLSVQRGGRRVPTGHFVVYGRPNGGRPTRIGITVSRKVGKAHDRNRVKRLVREAFRRHREALPRGLDLVLVARNDRRPEDFEQVVDELITAARRLEGQMAADRRSDRRRRR
jgi:ribonuclease P protein component